MADLRKFPQKEKRHVKQRLVWIAPPKPVLSPPTLLRERRIDRDGINTTCAIARTMSSGDTIGMVFGILNADGRIELGCTGTLYDNPLIASGLAGDLRALMDGWRVHPASYIADDDAEIL